MIDRDAIAPQRFRVDGDQLSSKNSGIKQRGPLDRGVAHASFRLCHGRSSTLAVHAGLVLSSLLVGTTSTRDFYVMSGRSQQAELSESSERPPQDRDRPD